jgi:glycosyltransferase involved in cell wall biosynthesis
VSTCSGALAAEVRDLGVFDPGIIHVAYNGIDTAGFRAHVSPGDWPELRATRYLVNVANFVPHKAQDRIIRAFAGVAETHPDLKLVLAGGRDKGIWLAELRQLASSLDLGDRVVFLLDVPHERVASLIAGAVALVHAAHHEAFGLVLIEAGALGVPVVAPAVGGVPEIGGDDAALLYAPGDETQLLACLRDVLDAPEAAAQRAARLYARVEERFSEEAMTDTYLGLYAKSP